MHRTLALLAISCAICSFAPRHANAFLPPEGAVQILLAAGDGDRAAIERRERIEMEERERHLNRAEKEKDSPRPQAKEMEKKEPRGRIEFRDPVLFDPDLLHFATREMPFAAEEIEKLLRSDEPQAREELAGWRDYLCEMRELRENNPDVYDLEKRVLILDWEAERLGERLADMPRGKQREETMKELVKVLKETFDLKEKLRAHDIEMLQRELDEQKNLLETRRKTKEQIIERRRQELTGESDALGW